MVKPRENQKISYVDVGICWYVKIAEYIADKTMIVIGCWDHVDGILHVRMFLDKS